MIRYLVIVPAKVKKGSLTIPPGEPKPKILAKSQKEAEEKATKLYGGSVLVFAPYNPNWK